MRTISSFKDYYDNLYCYNDLCSTDSVYVRNPSVTNITVPKSIMYKRTYDKFFVPFSIFILAFCGNFFVGIRVKKGNNTFYLYTNLHGSISFEKFTVIIRNIRNKDLDPLLFRTQKKLSIKSLKHQMLTDLFTSIRAKYIETFKPNDLHFLKKWNTPCFLYSPSLMIYPGYIMYGDYIQPDRLISTELNTDNNILINPQLSKLDFAKFMPPYIAHQEIETFLSNKLILMDNLEQITNNNAKIQKAGFDIKSSFRKRKK